MIAAVMGRFAAIAALGLSAAAWGWAADDLSGAARELARKTVAFAGRGEPVVVKWHNVSSLGSAELAQARTAFETALRDSGNRAADTATVEAQLTLSDNQSQYLIVEEVRKGDDRQVWIAGWKRSAPASVPGVIMEKLLLWEQTDPILDVVPNGNELVVLSPHRVTLRGERGSQTAAITSIRPWPRDLRGRLRLIPAGFKVHLPGVTCSGTFEPALTLDCRGIDEPWTLDALSRGVLLANFAAARNYFDGRVVSPAGVRKTVPAFYTIAGIEDQGRTHWVATLVDGRTQILDAAFETAGTIPSWGSDVAAVECRCAQLLSTKPGDAREPDELRAWSIVNRTAVSVAPPLEMPGPVTALWSLSGAEAIAVVRDLATGRYAAYLIKVACGA
jgi:hypothetical protein